MIEQKKINELVEFLIKVKTEFEPYEEVEKGVEYAYEYGHEHGVEDGKRALAHDCLKILNLIDEEGNLKIPSFEDQFMNSAKQYLKYLDANGYRFDSKDSLLNVLSAINLAISDIHERLGLNHSNIFTQNISEKIQELQKEISNEN